MKTARGIMQTIVSLASEWKCQKLTKTKLGVAQSIALFPGRFQPFHRGHLLSVQKILQENKHVIIGIRNTPLDDRRNIFSVVERRVIIREILADAQIDDSRVSVIVIDNETLGMELSYFFNIVYTGNDQMRSLFEPEYLVNTRIVRGYSATEVRKRLKAKEDISDLVHPGKAHLIEAIYRGRSFAH